MPATPAWPPRSLPRLFVETALGPGARVELDSAQANYLGNVLRMKADAQLLLFDGASGEWLAEISEADRKRIALWALLIAGVAVLGALAWRLSRQARPGT